MVAMILPGRIVRAVLDAIELACVPVVPARALALCGREVMGWGARPRPSHGMSANFLAVSLAVFLPMYWNGECGVRLKDYKTPEDGLDGDLGQEDLKRYDLKHLDLNQLIQEQADERFSGADRDLVAA